MDFIIAVAKYVFLTCTMQAVEKEEFAAVLPKLKSINHYELSTHTSNSKIVPF